MRSLRILVEIGHPAHVHFFKHPIHLWKTWGHHVYIVTRDKEITHALLNELGIPYTPLSKQQMNFVLQIGELLIRWIKIFLFIKKHQIDAAISISGISTAVPAHLSGIVAITDTDTEDATLSNAIAFRFSDVVLTPTAFLKQADVPHITTYQAFHELAYLHPNWFTPQNEHLQDFNLREEDRYIVIRLVRWKAVHDIHEQGISEENLKTLVYFFISNGYKVLISSERELSHPFSECTFITHHLSKIFDLLAFSSGYIGESPTMAMEAALLGKPSIFISSRAPYLGYTNELEKVYGLIRSFETFESARPFIEQEFCAPHLKQAITLGRQRLLDEKIDISTWIAQYTVDFTRNFYRNDKR